MLARAFIFLAIITAFLTEGKAQHTRVDSLESLIRSVPADTTKVWLLNELVSSIIDHQENTKAMDYARQSRDLASLLNYGKGLARSLELLGWIHYRMGDYSTSFELSNEALKRHEDLSDKRGIARCLINLAAIAYEQKYYARAVQNFKMANTISEQTGDLKTMARCLNNLAFNYINLKQADSATFYAEEALRLSNRINDQYMIGFAIRTQGDILFEKGDFSGALNKYSGCLLIAEKTGNNFIKASTLHRLGKTYNSLGQLDKALTYLLANIDFAKDHKYSEELERTSFLLAEIYHRKGDDANAFVYQSIYLKQHETLFDQRKADQLALLQAKFESEIKQAQIELLTKDTLLKEEEIKSQKVWMLFYSGLLVLVVILVFVLLTRNHFSRKAKHELELKNLEIQRQAVQLTNLNVTKDKIFSIIGHDLRSPVASLKGLMEVIGSGNLSQEQFTEVTRKLKKNLDVVYEDLDNVLQWAQSQLRGIQVHREEIRLCTLTDDILSLFSDAIRIKGIEVVNEIDAGAHVFADRNQLKLIFRNLVANSIKFNEPGGMIRIFTRLRANKIEVSVADSGIGIGMDELHKVFNAEIHFTKLGTNKEKGIGIGLLLTKEFVENNGGSIWVTSELGKGATFTFTLDYIQFEKKERANQRPLLDLSDAGRSAF